MPLNQLHRAFLTFFNTLAPNAQVTFRRPYLSRSGESILYPQYPTQDFELMENGFHRGYYYFEPLAQAVDAFYQAAGQTNFSEPTQANLLLLMRFFNTVSASLKLNQTRQLMRAPIYCIDVAGVVPLALLDAQEIATLALQHQNEHRVTNLIAVHIFFDAIQTLANAMNEIDIHTLTPQLANVIQDQNFDFTLMALQEFAGLPSIQEQIALWSMLSTASPSLANIFQAILTDPHVLWQIAGIASTLLLSTLYPELDARFAIAFNLAWETFGIWFFSQDNSSGTFLAAAYIGVLLFRAVITGFVLNPNIAPITSQFCDRFNGETLRSFCGNMLRGLNFAPLDRERLLLPPVMTWFTRRPLRFLPTITPQHHNAQISRIEETIRTVAAENRGLRHRRPNHQGPFD